MKRKDILAVVLFPDRGTGLFLAGTLRTERGHEYPSSFPYPPEQTWAGSRYLHAELDARGPGQ